MTACGVAPGADIFDGGAGNDMIYADEADIDGNAAADIDGGENMEMPGDMDTVSFEKLVDTEIEFSLVDNAVNVENVIGTDEDDDANW